jgi:hypothetical protein
VEHLELGRRSLDVSSGEIVGCVLADMVPCEEMLSLWLVQGVGACPGARFKNNPFDALLEIKDSIGNLTSYSDPGMPSVNNLLNTTTQNSIVEDGVPILDALGQA